MIGAYHKDGDENIIVILWAGPALVALPTRPGMTKRVLAPSAARLRCQLAVAQGQDRAAPSGTFLEDTSIRLPGADAKTWL